MTPYLHTGLTNSVLIRRISCSAKPQLIEPEGTGNREQRGSKRSCDDCPRAGHQALCLAAPGDHDALVIPRIYS